jgi:hypothetical protein
MPERIYSRVRRRVLMLVLPAMAAGCGDTPAGPDDPAPDAPLLIAFAHEVSQSRLRVGVVRSDGTQQRFVTDGTANASMPVGHPMGYS